jgi:hypothetical protein
LAVPTSTNKRQIFVIKYQELSNMASFLFRKSPGTAPSQANLQISPKEGFKIRAIKLKIIDARKK